MAPKNKVVVDGSKPSEGGEVEVEHGANGMPGQTIAPSGATSKDSQPEGGLKPFNDQLEQDVEKANRYEPDEPEIVKANQNQPAADSSSPQQTQQPALSQPAQPDAQPEHSPDPEHAGMYSTNPASVTQQPLENYHPTKSVIGTPENVREGAAPAAPTLADVPNKSGRKISVKKLLLVLLPILIIIGAAVYVFAFYLPNTPQNVWNTSLNRTGKQVDALVEKLSQEDAFLAYEKTKIKAEGTLESNGQKFQINVDSNYDSQNSDSKAALQSDDGAGGVLQLEALLKTTLPEGAQFPNVYFNISGFKSLGLDAFLGGVSEYDGRWIAVEQDFINQLTDSIQSEPSEDSNSSITYQQVMTVVQDFNAVTQKYLFNSDEQNSIFILKEFIATEESEGITANHYKASINGQNLQNWCGELVDKLAQNQTFKDLMGVTQENLAAEVQEQKAQCADIDAELNAEDDFDIWMDKSNKIIHKIRLYQEPTKSYTQRVNDLNKQAEYQDCLADNNGNESPCQAILGQNVDSEVDLGTKYQEFGQVYKGRNEVLLFANFKEETKDVNSNTRVELNVNTDNLAFNGQISQVTKTDLDDSKLELNISTEPFNGDIDSAKPSNTVPIQEVLNKLYGAENPYAELQSSARDSKRQSDISSIHTALEAYFVQNQTYPSFKQINDPEFRNESMPGLSSETFSDPGATSDILSDRAGINVYSYVVVPTNCDGARNVCSYYELSARLEDGSLYTKEAVQ